MSRTRCIYVKYERDSVSVRTMVRVIVVKRIDAQLTPNIIWYWSILCLLKTRS